MKSMKFKCGATIPVGTLVYKKVYELNSYGGAGQGRVITCIVTKPGFCPNRKEGAGKSRVPEVFVAGVTSRTKVTTFISGWDGSFEYKLYEKKSSKFDNNKDTVCTDGIHVFLTKSAAQRY